MKISSYPRVQGTAALALTPSLEAEFAKDSWDVRNIPGLRYPPHAGPSYIHFHAIPERFRPIAKDHAKFLIAADRAAQTG